MSTSSRNIGKINCRWFILTIACLFVVPSISLADLRQMDEKEMKSVYLNDFSRPSQTPMIVGPNEKELTVFEHQTDAAPMAVQAKNMAFDTEGLTRDLEAQHKNMMEGGRVAFPVLSNYMKNN